MTKEELLAMELHEIKSIPCKSHKRDVMRVYCGWIYTQTDILEATTSCFVPEIINVEGDVTNHY